MIEQADALAERWRAKAALFRGKGNETHALDADARVAEYTALADAVWEATPILKPRERCEALAVEHWRRER